MFALHPDFARSAAPVASLGLSDVLLHLDARFPWLVLVPRVAGASGLEDLSEIDRARLMTEVMDAGRVVRAIGAARGRPVERLNVGILGNITPQLHIHVVGRWAGDPAWPGPVWGAGAAEAYSDTAMVAALAAARTSFTA